MINVNQDIKMKKCKYKNFEQLNDRKNMTQGDSESIKDFRRSGGLLKCIHNNGAMDLSVVIMYSIVD